MMGTVIDLTNQRFGHLTVLKRAENNKENRACWLCICDCGKEVVYTSQVLRSGQAKSCGCSNKKDLSNKIFGRLTVIKYAYSKNGQRYWECKCGCGNTTFVSTKSLVSGNTQSCGCLRREAIIRANISNKSKIDQSTIIGKTFDYLTVLKKDESKEKTYYYCKCNHCGNIKSIRYSDIVSGRIHACGCLQSWGETQLKLKLTEKRVSFKTQFSFNDLKSKKNYPLRFDIAILNKQQNVVGLIEYQGEQHFDITNNWHTDQLEENDLLKKNYCSEHNIPLKYCDKNTNLDDFVAEVVDQWLPLEFSV